MSSIKSVNMYKPRDNFLYMTQKNFIWGFIGLCTGIIINNIVIYLNNKLKINTLIIQNILQVLLCAIILSSLHSYFHFFGWSWQSKTEGLFFVSFFFGVQFNLLNNIQNTYGKIDTKEQNTKEQNTKEQNTKE
jgi:hypothetical protein